MNSISKIEEFVDISYALLEVQEAVGTNNKLRLLEEYEDLPGFKDVLKFIYNPYVKSHISTKKLQEAYTMTYCGTQCTYDEVIAYLSNSSTGSAADIRVVRDFIMTHYSPDGIVSDFAEALVTQNLKLGVSTKSINKVYGKSFIPVTGVMLGKPIEDGSKVYWPSIVTEKLDGVRRALIKENGKVTLVSRSGIKDEGLVDIISDAEYLPDNFVYDGEILANGIFKDSIALRQATNSICNSGGIRTGVSFNIFDMVRLEDFYAGISTMPAIERKIRLGATLKDDSIMKLTPDYERWINGMWPGYEFKHIRAVPILGIAKNLDEAYAHARGVWSDNGEGVMLNYIDGPYEVKRSKYLIKVKDTYEYTLPIVGLQEGNGEFSGTLGAFLVDYKGTAVGVGSGLTKYQREKYWDMGATLIGTKLELDCFGESTNVNGGVSLNCPIFKRLVGEE